MIPFASQRGLGQDLATHLQNQFDNEYTEVAELRGAVARDLHGAFAEWEIQAHALTKCRNYLYSLSVNPDPAQGELTRDQYFDYIGRTEDSLGLTGQPRAVVFHIKPDKNGNAREHCHVVWSRIDMKQGKAIQLAFDHDKLITTTRAFARDHGLELPDGYHKDRGRQRNKQLSLYEQYQQRSTGLTIEARMEQVTGAWRQSDSPQAFVQALAAQGYMLATGKRPYVLVDIYGQMNALPKLIDDKTIRTKDIRAFLKKDYPPESLPDVEEAKKLAANHRKAFDDYRDHEQHAEAVAQLKKAQAQRRQQVEEQQALLAQRQHKEREALAKQQRAARDAHRTAYLGQVKTIRRQRHKNRPQGLAALFGKVSGIELLREKLQRFQDRRRYRAYLKQSDRQRQEQQRRELGRRHELQTLDLQRHIRALNHIDKRELKSLEESLRAEQRIQARGGRDQMPALNLDLKPRGRPVAAHKATDGHDQGLTDAYEQAMTMRLKPVDLEEAFTRAAEGEQETGDTGDSSEGPKPAARSRSSPRPQRRRNRSKDRER